MEVIVRNLDQHMTESRVEKFFKPILKSYGIDHFHCQKLKAKGCATFTVLDPLKCQRFLYFHGQVQPGRKGFNAVRRKLFIQKNPVNCMVSTNAPNEWIVFALRKEESDRHAALSRKALTPGKVESRSEVLRPRAFDISRMQVGQLWYSGGNLVFSDNYADHRTGRIIFGSRSLLIKLWPMQPGQAHYQLQIWYDSIESFVVGDNCVTLSLIQAPRLFENLDGDISLEASLRKALGIQAGPTFKPMQSFKRTRLSALNDKHREVVASCFCYRLTLTSLTDSRAVQGLKGFEGIPNIVIWNIPVQLDIPIPEQMAALQCGLAEVRYGGAMPFEVKFQLQKLAQNTYLKPTKVIELFPCVRSHLRERSVAIVASALRHLASSIPFAGPDAEEENFKVNTLTSLLQKSIESVFEDDPYSLRLAEEHDHIAMVHKALVTPTGIFLYGPEPETKNRILRKYSTHLDNFISVSFVDENYEHLRFERDTSSEDIYQRRFQGILDGFITIAGRNYEFLGFSHSSLREQACWFMAPFIMDRTLLHARAVIEELGDFGHIRSPAKCAARIGQAFSQTLSAITISGDAIMRIPDVERNGRTFSDGCGTCSPDVLAQVWEGYRGARGLKPTILQIRFQGAKGVISLDSRLQGEKLCLRRSMIKFEGSTDTNVEICGASNKPLPMYLNRQVIKILEDLKVPNEPFLRLQAAAVEELRQTTVSPLNASTFFHRNRIGTAARLSFLIKKLFYWGFDFIEDHFLRDTLETAVLVQVREIKYRSRILVGKGWTLYGIMDETGILKENQIYCAAHLDHGIQVLTGNVVITRCPALHPGDIQVVEAIKVPEDNPLYYLHNVVVFSSYGDRDLPSKLSGGDLDGDLYNVIWDPDLYPKQISPPADYPIPEPINIGRPVERGDMTKHFVTFMENDTLGMIATLHQILADQAPTGTLDPTCIKLAGLHSSAVDFSKTGIPVSRMELPKYPKARPDFQAPGPRVVIDKCVGFEASEDPIDTPIETDEMDEANSFGPPRIRYYPSNKVLGKLYRAIDEHKFFAQIQKQSSRVEKQDHSLIERVWQYVSKKAALIEWTHYTDFAKTVKENYEDLLTDTMLQFASHPHHPVSEIEVFSGSILGKIGSQSKQQRENCITMKDKFDRDVQYITSWITHGDDKDGSTEALERSLACLWVGMRERGFRQKVGDLVSFRWIAAAVCLKEVERLGGGDKAGVGWKGDQVALGWKESEGVNGLMGSMGALTL